MKNISRNNFKVKPFHLVPTWGWPIYTSIYKSSRHFHLSSKLLIRQGDEDVKENLTPKQEEVRQNLFEKEESARDDLDDLEQLDADKEEIDEAEFKVNFYNRAKVISEEQFNFKCNKSSLLFQKVEVEALLDSQKIERTSELAKTCREFAKKEINDSRAQEGPTVEQLRALSALDQEVWGADRIAAAAATNSVKNRDATSSALDNSVDNSAVSATTASSASTSNSTSSANSVTESRSSSPTTFIANPLDTLPANTSLNPLDIEELVEIISDDCNPYISILTFIIRFFLKLHAFKKFTGRWW